MKQKITDIFITISVVFATIYFLIKLIVSYGPQEAIVNIVGIPWSGQNIVNIPSVVLSGIIFISYVIVSILVKRSDDKKLAWLPCFLLVIFIPIVNFVSSIINIVTVRRILAMGEVYLAQYSGIENVTGRLFSVFSFVAYTLLCIAFGTLFGEKEK